MSDSPPPKTLEEALKALERCGNAKVREMNARNGAPENQFGVRMGDIRNIAKAIKIDHELGLQLWATGNADARLLAILILRPKLLSEDDLEQMVASVTYPQLA